MQKWREAFSKYHHYQCIRGRTTALQLPTGCQPFTNDNTQWKDRGLLNGKWRGFRHLLKFFADWSFALSAQAVQERKGTVCLWNIYLSILWLDSLLFCLHFLPFCLHFLFSDSFGDFYNHTIISWLLVMSWVGSRQCQQDEKKNRKIYASPVM